jgi:diadenosine tetraphosphate (Ap4A) HIT family hydrolase
VSVPGCELCEQPGGLLIHRTERWRVIRAVDANFPAFYRVIWNAHVAECSDLATADRQELIDVVTRVEQTLREALVPTKINLASLGNVVPHLHWHVIARFDWDSHFPQPVWGAAQRTVEPPAAARLPMAIDALDARMAEALAALGHD